METEKSDVYTDELTNVTDTIDLDSENLKTDSESDTEYDDNILSENNIQSTSTNQLITKTNLEMIKKKPNKTKTTNSKITKYEKVRIIGTRTKQLMLGAKPLIKHDDILSLSALQITLLEYDNNMIPFKIKRNLPDGSFELWKFNELKK
tara:strand:- start:28 stop:474 length:447 start_codon:yes stop_codon:yes gene_type:complete